MTDSPNPAEAEKRVAYDRYATAAITGMLAGGHNPSNVIDLLTRADEIARHMLINREEMS